MSPGPVAQACSWLRHNPSAWGPHKRVTPTCAVVSPFLGRPSLDPSPPAKGPPQPVLAQQAGLGHVYAAAREDSK